MRAYLALFDPAFHSPLGHWTWSHDSVPEPILNTLYFDYIAGMLPLPSDSLKNNELVGGVTGLRDQWVAWFRFFDGGRDLFGRPGRYVVLAAFARRPIGMVDPLSVLQSESFEKLCGRATQCPVPILETLTMEFHSDRVEPTQESEWAQLQAIQGPVGIERLGAILAELPSECEFLAQVRVGMEIAGAELSIRSIPLAEKTSSLNGVAVAEGESPARAANSDDSDSPRNHVRRHGPLLSQFHKQLRERPVIVLLIIFALVAILFWSARPRWPFVPRKSDTILQDPNPVAPSHAKTPERSDQK